MVMSLNLQSFENWFACVCEWTGRAMNMDLQVFLAWTVLALSMELHAYELGPARLCIDLHFMVFGS